MIRPRVSIIVPVFNGGAFLPVAVNSVLNQSLQDWELIIINDGSNDNTHLYLDQISEPRIKIIHQHNQGVASARNAGLNIASGDVVTFLDADDALPIDSLMVRLNYLDQNPEVTLVDGTILVGDAALDKTLHQRFGGFNGPYFSRLLKMDPSVFFSIAIMVRRDAIGSTRFRPGLTHCEDLLFFLEAADGKSWIYGAVNEPVYVYRTGVASAMNDLDGLSSGYDFLYNACHNLIDVTPADLAYLKARIRRIMVRSWIRRGNLLKAWRAFNR